MPQNAGQFVPDVWSRPRPNTMGAVLARVLGGGGDRLHPRVAPRLPGPGADGWALLPDQPKMAYAVQGAGYIVRNNGASQVFSGPQVFWKDAQIASGVNGIVYMGAYQQGLINYEAYLAGYSGAPQIGGGRG